MARKTKEKKKVKRKIRKRVKAVRSKNKKKKIVVKLLGKKPMIKKRAGALSECFNFISDSRKFILIVFVLFLVSLLVGYLFPVFFIKELEQIIAELIEKASGLDFPGLTSFIIYNNIKASFFAVILGVFFAIPPLFFAVLNGYLLGFVLNSVVKAEGVKEIWRLFPHGIFELPAFFISLAMGLRFGYTLFFKTKKIKKELRLTLKTFLYVIIPLLLIAGIIESALIFLIR